MVVFFNSKLIPEEQVLISYKDRSFQYGDGLFETMVFTKGKIRFIKDHLERLKKGMKALAIKGGKELTTDWLLSTVSLLVKENKLKGDARVKLQLWRKEGGLYTPTNGKFNLLVSVQDLKPAETTALQTDFAETTFVKHSVTSPFKTTSALTYVLAGIEKSEKERDDMILMNTEGYIAEMISSNIFWIKDDVVYTPKTAVGCVAGVARRNVITTLEASGYKVRKVMARKFELLQADFVFSVNTMGVKSVIQIGDAGFRQMDAWKVLMERAYH
ncbi:aminotransferase class IV [Limibacter armeniacum]|uniref:aminotransferase class IV n=1 Tax=Limibacter armeniacum TaxID=466084 RepID=UPI002FE66D28